MKTTVRRPARPALVQESLCDLLRRLSDACESESRWLERAAREVSNDELALLFTRYSRRRADLAKQLWEQIDGIEGRQSGVGLVVKSSRSRASKLPPYRRDDATILSECEDREAELRALYETALAREDLPGDLPMCLRRQSLAINDAYDQIHDLCAALAWCAVPMAV